MSAYTNNAFLYLVSSSKRAHTSTSPEEKRTKRAYTTSPEEKRKKRAHTSPEEREKDNENEGC